MHRFLIFIVAVSVSANALQIDFRNVTGNGENDIVFFNRVPKVGSQMMMSLISKLSRKLNFGFHRDGVHKHQEAVIDFDTEKSMVTTIHALPVPSAYTKHIFFLNFTRHGLPQPIYINMVRDPIERAISWFYYTRNTASRNYATKLGRGTLERDASWFSEDFETCVEKRKSECAFAKKGPRPHSSGFTSSNSLIKWFCGTEPICDSFNNPVALAKAKHNVENHYAVVGVLEEVKKSLEVFSAIIPRFFSNALDIYQEQEGTMSKINRNTEKRDVSENTKRSLRKLFDKEIEFYEFCKQRLHGQFMAYVGIDDQYI